MLHVCYGSRVCENVRGFAVVDRLVSDLFGFSDFRMLGTKRGVSGGILRSDGDPWRLGRKSTQTSAYVALMAAISGPTPMMAMTRLIL